MHSIAFNRGLFDAEHFKDSTRFGGAKVKELQPETASARRVIAMLEKGVFAILVEHARKRVDSSSASSPYSALLTYMSLVYL